MTGQATADTKSTSELEEPAGAVSHHPLQVRGDVLGPGEGHRRRRAGELLHQVHERARATQHREAGAHLAVGARQAHARVVARVVAEQLVAVRPGDVGLIQPARPGGCAVLKVETPSTENHACQRP